MRGWPDVSIKASFSTIISQMLLEVMLRFCKALIAQIFSGPPGSFPLARTTVPNAPLPNLLTNWKFFSDTFPSRAISVTHWWSCRYELLPTSCKFCAFTLVLIASSSFSSSWLWVARICFSPSQAFVFDSKYLFKLTSTVFTRSSSVRSLTSVFNTFPYLFWTLLLIALIFSKFFFYFILIFHPFFSALQVVISHLQEPHKILQFSHFLHKNSLILYA